MIYFKFIERNGRDQNNYIGPSYVSKPIPPISFTVLYDIVINKVNLKNENLNI